MTLNEFSRFLQTKSVGRVEPPINEQLTERVYTAMKKIAMDTNALRWVVDTEIGHDIMSRLDSYTFVRYPLKPVIDSGDQLDIEEALIDALALYVMAGLEIQRAKVNMAMYHEQIDRYNQNLIQTHMQEATNDAERFYQFP